MRTYLLSHLLAHQASQHPERPALSLGGVTTSYGELAVDRGAIISIVFQEYSPSEATFDVPGNYFAPQNKWFESKLAVSKDDQLDVVARGEIQLQNYGWTVGPEGSTDIGGNHFKDFPAASLVARIGDRGKPFLVGARHRGKANASGKLSFAIAFRGGQVSGAFNVRVRVKRQEQEEEEE